MFTETFSSHLIFWPFPTVTLMSHFRHLPYISSCEWYVMMLCYQLTIIQDLLYRYILGILHRLLFPKIDFLCHRLSLLLSLPNNQNLCDLFYHSCCIPCLRRDFFQSYCRFCFRFCFPNILTLYGRTCHTCCIHSWRICCYCFFISFIQSLTL